MILTKGMTGNFIGPMPATGFIREFMNSDDFEAPPKVDFTKVPYDGPEREIQPVCMWNSVLLPFTYYSHSIPSVLSAML